MREGERVRGRGRVRRREREGVPVVSTGSSLTECSGNGHITQTIFVVSGREQLLHRERERERHKHTHRVKDTHTV